MLKRIALAAIVASGPVFAQDADTVVSTVNGAEITLGQMAAMKAALPPAMAATPTAELWDLILDQMIKQTAMAEAGEKEMTSRDKAAIEIDRRAYLAGVALERLADFEPDEAEVLAAYNKAFPAGEPLTEYDADHILLETEAAATDVIAELAKGTEFDKLAAERSTDTASGLNGGDLGWFTAEKMLTEFSDAVAGMENGTTSAAPVKSPVGWHVIKLNDTRIVEPPELASVREQLVQQIRRDRVEAKISAITSDAKVEKTEGMTSALLERDVLGLK